MKKQIGYILLPAFIFMLLLMGCSEKGSTSYTSDPSVSRQPGVGAKDADKSPETAPGLSNPEAVKYDKKALGKVLVVYYSFSGNTHQVAETVKEMTGGEIFEIQPDFDYKRPDLEDLAKKQINEGYKPKLKSSVSNIESYDLIFVGSPTWWFTPAPPVLSFLSEHDLKEKKIVPFCTYKGSFGDYFKKFENAAQGAKVLKGRDFTSEEIKDMEKVKQKIGTWLKEIEQSK